MFAKVYTNHFPASLIPVRVAHSAKTDGGLPCRTHALVRLATAVLDSYPVFFDRRRAELSRAEPHRIMRERRRQTAGAARSSLHLPGPAGAVLPRRPTVVEAVALSWATSLHARSDALPGVARASRAASDKAGCDAGAMDPAPAPRALMLKRPPHHFARAGETGPVALRIHQTS